MTPAARLSAAIELIGTIDSDRVPAAKALKEWGTAHRYAGSGDRAAISGLIDVTTLQATAAAPAPSELRLNQLATVSVRLGEPIYADAYADNPPNGAFVIIDTDTSSTAGVGFVAAPAAESAAPEL